jgi:beta-glucosidase
VISAPLDVLGINYYTPTTVTAASPDLQAGAAGRRAHGPEAGDGATSVPGTDRAFTVPDQGPRTAMGWVIEPSTLTELLLRVHRDYPYIPLMITENGAAFADEPADDGVVHDDDRIDYLRGHLTAVHDAISHGADVRGYYCWSLMDNFEWSWGLSKRFGLVYVDYSNCERSLKDSAWWYRGVIAANGLD